MVVPGHVHKGGSGALLPRPVMTGWRRSLQPHLLILFSSMLWSTHTLESLLWCEPPLLSVGSVHLTMLISLSSVQVSALCMTGELITGSNWLGTGVKLATAFFFLIGKAMSGSEVQAGWRWTQQLPCSEYLLYPSQHKHKPGKVDLLSSSDTHGYGRAFQASPPFVRS